MSEEKTPEKTAELVLARAEQMVEALEREINMMLPPEYRYIMWMAIRERVKKRCAPLMEMRR